MTLSNLRILLLSGMVFAGSFVGAVVSRSQPASQPSSSLGRWLDLAVEQEQAIQSHDPAFDRELVELRQALDRAREELINVLESNSASDEQLREKGESIIDAHNRLERRVIEHLIAVRSHLTADQQRKLFDRCAEGVREQGQRRWRHGWRGGTPESRDAQPGPRGPGRGSGRHGGPHQP